MSWESQVFPLQYQDFLHQKSYFPHLKSNFSCTKSDLPELAFYFLQRLSAFFNGFLTFFNGFLLSPMVFQISPMSFQFYSTVFCFPRNPRKSFYGKKYTKDRYSSFLFFATCSPSFVITAKQYLCLIQQWVSRQQNIHGMIILPGNQHHLIKSFLNNEQFILFIQ